MRPGGGRPERVQGYFGSRHGCAGAGIALFAAARRSVPRSRPTFTSRSRLHRAPGARVWPRGEFGTILVARATAQRAVFEVTAYDVGELPSLTAEARGGEVPRRAAGKAGTCWRADWRAQLPMRIASSGSDNYAQVRIASSSHTQRPCRARGRRHRGGRGCPAAAAAHIPHDLVLGVVRLNPKRVTGPKFARRPLVARGARARLGRAHAEAVREGVGTGGR